MLTGGGSAAAGASGQLGEKCSPVGSIACAGEHQKLVLVCGAEGTWEPNGTCGSGEFCQSATGVDQGTCLPEVEECRGLKPATKVCKGDEVRECGADAVTSVLVETCSNGCVSGACQGAGECQAGRANCDSQPDCETDLMTSSTNCGSCGANCAGPHATGTCEQGLCACEPSFADCSDAAGCETDTSTDADNCGGCAHACGSGQCVAGVCAVRVFVTSETYSGNLGGLAGADQKCQTLADGAGLGGQFRAWLSDSNTPLSARFEPSPAGYVRLDGEVIADDWAELTSDIGIQASVSIDEKLEPVSTSQPQYVWTGQGTDQGQVFYCMDWMSALDSDRGLAGEATFKNWMWDYWGPRLCGGAAHLYCFEIFKN
jgi:hypothetical protein